MLKTFKHVTHVIFDLDGLLIDTEHSYEKMVAAILNKYGKQHTQELKLKIRGTPEPRTSEIVVEDMDLPITPNQFLQEYDELGKTFLQSPPLFEGAEKLIRHFHNNNIPIAVATSSSKDSVDIKLKDYKEIFELFNHIVMGSTDPEVKNGKPHPDIFLICATRFSDKPSPEQCLVFEDAPNGVIAATKAGMQVVMVPSKEVDDEMRKPATLVLDSLLDFEPSLFGLPPFEK